MRTCLVYLPHPHLVQPNMMAPLGLLYVASAFEALGHPTTVRNYSGIKYSEAIDDLPEAELYGISVTSLEIPAAQVFANGIKLKYPNAKVILGGPGTATPELVQMKWIDSLVQGEGEIVAEEIAQDVERGALKSLYVGTTVPDLNLIPLPARHLVSDDFSTLSVVTSRGCPFSCAFCASPKLASNKMRYRSVDNVMLELTRHKANNLVIHDDMFTANKKRMIELCKAIGTLGVNWRMNIRSRPLDLEMLQAAKDAGCDEAAIGIESFDENVLRSLRKKTTLADNVHALWMLDKVGIKTRLLLMIRTPGQTKKTMDLNKYWLQRLPHYMVACTNFVPIPGCDVWHNPEDYDVEILTRELKMYNYGFFDSNGEIPLLPIFKLKDRSLKEFHRETQDFKDWLTESTKVNAG